MYQKLVMKKIQRDTRYLKRHWTNQPNRGTKDQGSWPGTDGERIGLDMNDWTGLDQLEKFERIQYVDVTPK